MPFFFENRTLHKMNDVLLPPIHYRFYAIEFDWDSVQSLNVWGRYTGHPRGHQDAKYIQASLMFCTKLFNPPLRVDSCKWCHEGTKGNEPIGKL